MLDAQLIEILACPKCKSSVSVENEESIFCKKCSLAYPIKDGIPVMLVDEAVHITEK